MTFHLNSRRRFLKSLTGAAAGTLLAGRSSSGASPYVAPRPSQKTAGPNQQLAIGCIGMRYQGSVIAHKAMDHGIVVAISDVDRHVREQARASFGSRARIYEDYRDMLAREDLDVITIGAPDHWHAKMLVDACRAGKDVYCEKPLTLTIDEGKVIRKVVKETGRVVQVGSWQRSDDRFRRAVEMVHQGRIGELRRVDVTLSKNRTGGPFKPTAPPPQLNWDLWQGQTPDVPYMHERCHYDFRWWYAYSGGQMTDWGAHHIDIAQWAIGKEPIEIETTARFPQIENGFDVATDFHAIYRYPGGIEMTVSDSGRTGILLTGSEGRVFVNRGVLEGKPVEDLKQKPLDRQAYQLYPNDNLERPPRSGKLDAIVNHMGNFFDCLESREAPISDVESQHRSATTCHLGNISMWLGRTLRWDASAEQFIDDVEANARMSREQRPGFEIA